MSSNCNRKGEKKTDVVCEGCNISLKNKSQYKKHIKSCVLRRICKWCNIEFTNRGNLVAHAYHVHGDESLKKKKPVFTCKVCKQAFRGFQILKNHIQQNHNNCQVSIPLFEAKNVNDVWYEKVRNSTDTVKVTKTSPSSMIIKRHNADVPVETETSPIMVDASHLYPTNKGQRSQKMKCDICNILLLKRLYKKHYDEKHSDVVKHQCNYCKATFKRSYFFVRHVCNKTRKPRRKAITKIKNEVPILV